MATKVVLDANALLLPFESGIRIQAELERLVGPVQMIVPEGVLQELAYIASTAKGRRAANARAALTLAAHFIPRAGTGRGDVAVLEAAKREGALLFTNDRALLRLGLQAGLTIVRLKGKSHLILETLQGEVR